MYQCCGSGSTLILIDFGRLDPDPDPDPGGYLEDFKEKKKGKRFHVSKCWMFSFDGWRLLLYLGHPSWRSRDKNELIFHL
jgi:hypothetical protein